MISGARGNRGLEQDILPLFPLRLRRPISSWVKAHQDYDSVEEIRLRKGLPVCIVSHRGDHLLADGTSYLLTLQEDIDRILSLITDCSYHALESELANGFITIPGGHRVGLAGQVASFQDGSTRLREITGFNFRVARQVLGAGEKVVPFLKGPSGILHSTLIVSPPGCGKTTLLRDLCRISGEGMTSAGLRAVQVGIVDERSEIAACFDGVPQHNVGPRADVLDRCPKAKGIMMLLRAMGPQIIATDEIGSNDDAAAVAMALSGGVSLLATCHGNDFDDVKRRPYSSWLISGGYFQRGVILSRRLGPGTLEYAGEIR